LYIVKLQNLIDSKDEFYHMGFKFIDYI